MTKGPYFNYVSTFLSIFDQLSTLVSIFTTVPDNSYSTLVSILQTKYEPLCAIVIKVWPLMKKIDCIFDEGDLNQTINMTNFYNS